MGLLDSSLSGRRIAIGVGAVLFYWTAVAQVSAGEETSSCAQAAPLEMLTSSHFFERLCDITAASNEIDFFVARGSTRHNSLLSSKLMDYFTVFPHNLYRLDKVGTGKLYRISVVVSDQIVNSSPTGISSYLFSAGDGVTWIRCNEGFDHKCSIYRDVSVIREESEWKSCKIQVIAKFSNPPSEDVVSVSMKYLDDISEKLVGKRHDDMVAACNRKDK